MAAAIAGLCAPLWTLSYFATQDGPAHLNTSFVIAWYHRIPEFASTFHLYFQPAGNALYHLLSAALMRVTSPMVAERLLLSAYFVLWPLAIWYAVRPWSRHALAIAAGALPLAGNYFFHMGFWNYCYGLVFALFALGGYVRMRRGELAAVWFLLLAVATFFFHVMAFGWLAVVVVLLAGAELLGQRREDGGADRRLRSFLLLLGASLAPAALFVYWLLASSQPAAAANPEPGLLQRLRALVGMTFAVAYGDRETLWLGALVVAFGCWVLLGVWTGWRMARRSTDALLVGAAAFAGLAMVMPENIGDASFVVMRLVMLAWLCVLLWLATLPWSARTLTAVAAGGAILCVGHVALLYPSYVRYARHMESVERLADRIPPRASFASRRVGKTVSRVLPTLHVADLVALKPAVNLSLYQASRSHFLIAYREGVSEDQAAYLLAERTLPRPESGADPLAGLVPAERYRLLATSDDRYTDLYIASDRAPAR